LETLEQQWQLIPPPKRIVNADQLNDNGGCDNTKMKPIYAAYSLFNATTPPPNWNAETCLHSKNQAANAPFPK
jgi:hypothetical protein